MFFGYRDDYVLNMLADVRVEADPGCTQLPSLVHKRNRPFCVLGTVLVTLEK